MKTDNTQAWWRELGAISRGMMFIEGNIATPTALDSATQGGHTHVPAPRPSPPSGDHRPLSPTWRSQVVRLYRDLLFLGGRPMTVGHNDDINEPFPQTDGDVVEPQPRWHRPGARRHNRTPQSQSCATC